MLARCGRGGLGVAQDGFGHGGQSELPWTARKPPGVAWACQLCGQWGLCTPEGRRVAPCSRRCCRRKRRCAYEIAMHGDHGDRRRVKPVLPHSRSRGLRGELSTSRGAVLDVDRAMSS